MEKNDKLLSHLITAFYSSGMLNLGKMANPLTNKIERNLKQASEYIDFLEMVKSKTKNNLTLDQEKMLDGFLTQLRLNYIDELNKESSDLNNTEQNSNIKKENPVVNN